MTIVKLSRDEYFMHIAKVCATKSIDPSSKFGCVAVSNDGSILSTGYNGPPRNVDDDTIPLTRPEKYTFMEHAERNCIYNAARVGIPLKGCIFYVTGISCFDCMRGMYQSGASAVVMLSKSPSSANDEWYKFIAFIENYITIRYM